jgi:hypothetical protein
MFLYIVSLARLVYSRSGVVQVLVYILLCSVKFVAVVLFPDSLSFCSKTFPFVYFVPGQFEHHACIPASTISSCVRTVSASSQ